MANLGLVRRIAQSIEKIIPLQLAESSWDNVGLLVEPLSSHNNFKKIFLCIDLTEQTLQESQQIDGVGFILAYHPPLFKAIKSLSTDKVKDRILLSCIENKVAIYSPHTAADNCKDGVNDWLAKSCNYSTCEPIIPYDLPGSGSGRLVKIEPAIKFSNLVENVKAYLNLDKIRVAKVLEGGDQLISTVAICAGSGSGVLSNIEADCYLTGELSHHDILHATANNTSVILTEHSNSERGYLNQVLKAKLQAELDKLNCKLEVVVSQTDKDPISIL